MPDGPLKAFALGLRELRQDAGLTYRRMEQRAGYSIAVLSAAAAGERLPTLPVTLAYVGACGGDQSVWQTRWEDLAQRIQATDPGLLTPEAPAADQAADASANPAHRSGWNSPPAIKPLDEDTPPRIGIFQILGILGGGAMADVYLATSDTRRAVAVKVVRRDLARDPLFRRRFEAELVAARKVQAANVPAVIGGDARAQLPWMASEYVPGPTLAEIVESDGPLSEGATQALMSGIAEALSVLHAAGIVHRDLKPGNVLLTREGPKVIDFGVARALDGTVLTAVGMAVGTAGFMAPEQAEGKQVNLAADIFALGCLAAYASSGVPPFGEGPSTAVLYRIVHDEPDEKALACINKQLRDLIKRCLAKDPAQRPAVEEILKTCQAVPAVAGWPPAKVAEIVAQHQADAQGLLRRAARRRRVRRMQLATVTTALVALGITATAVLLDGGSHRAAGGAKPSVAPKSSGHRLVRSTPATGAGPQPSDVASVSAIPGPSTTGTPTPSQQSASPATNPSTGAVAGASQVRYSFDCGTDGWSRIGGDVTLAASSKFQRDGACALAITDASTNVAIVADAAVSALSDGPIAGATVTAWIYVPVDNRQTVNASLYVKDASGHQYTAPATAVLAGSGWQQLRLTTSLYSGPAKAVGLQFTKSGTGGLTAYLDKVSW